jgi:hypothetical protein
MRHFFELFLFKSSLNLARLGGEHGGISFHRYLDTRGAQLKGDEDAANLAAFQHYVLRHESLEAGMSKSDDRSAGQIDNFEISIFVSVDSAREVRLGADYLDFRIHNHGAGLIYGSASQSGYGQLSRHGCYREPSQQWQQQPKHKGLLLKLIERRI